MVKVDTVKTNVKKWQRSVFRTLLVSMMTFGIVIGLVFPFFTRVALGYEKALTTPFFVMCVIAGLAVGGFNFFLFKALVSRELGKIAQGMQDINEEMESALYGDDASQRIHQLAVTSDDQIGEVVSIFNAMSQAIDERVRLERTFRKHMAKLSSSVELENVARAIVDGTVEIVDMQGGAILYGSLTDEMPLLDASNNLKKDALPAQFNQQPAATSKVLDANQLQILIAEPDIKEWGAVFEKAIATFPTLVGLIPLVSEKRTIGVIVLGYMQSYLSIKHRKKLEMFREYIAPYLQNALLHQRIQEIASLDGLTGCLNRRYGMRRLHEEFSLALRTKNRICVILFDIDYFKKVNDKFGHAAGDYVLKRVASLLEEDMRAGEKICRYGGEEFLVIVPSSGRQEAAVLAERLRGLVEDKTFEWDGQALQVTISLGLACWPSSQVDSAEELVNEADAALYFAKESGRNLTAVNEGGQMTLVANM